MLRLPKLLYINLFWKQFYTFLCRFQHFKVRLNQSELSTTELMLEKEYKKHIQSEIWQVFISENISFELYPKQIGSYWKY